ncbi:oligosaccharide flippase family protein [Litoribacter alkaliphilus]|uniref:Oligosaccharide flippase family protein n=1 Tax=Litoribacter ruber TaxID=702568 RepID=A0AAP2CK82_9BACT|nr:oligosaccharide flippase family protein [Litoribacter alkaliphilus]MBS9525692.1 oligosaccharide flippase family protein [Litoribacter alkaliphilus]
MLKSLLKDSLIYTIPSILSRGLAFFLFPLYTQVLTPTEYGGFDLLTYFGNLVNLTVALEVGQAVGRFYTEEKDIRKKKLIASTAFWFSLLSYSLFFVLALIFADFITVLLLDDVQWSNLFQTYTIYICLYGLFGLLQNQFRWEFRSKDYAVISMVVTIVSAFISIYLAYFKGWGIRGIYLGLIIGSLLGCIIGIYKLRETIVFDFAFNVLKPMLRFSIPLIPSSIAVFLSVYIDRFMINHYLTLTDVGLYGIGYRLASIVGLVMVGFKGAITPLIYSNYNKTETPGEISRIFRYFISVGIIMFLFLSVFSKELLLILTTPEFAFGAQVVVFLVPAIFFANMYMFTPGMAIRKKTAYFIYLNIFGALLNVGLNYFLIPIFGISGAAISTFLGYAVTFGLYMAVSQKLYFVPHNFAKLILSFVAVFIIGYLGYYLNLNLIQKLGVFISGMSIIIIGGLVEFKEIKLISSKVVEKYKAII